jgi:hypothetical protein
MAKEITRGKKGKNKSTGKAKGGANSKHRKNGAGAAAAKGSKSTSKNEAGRGAKARPVYANDYGLMTAFHHMQRASVVMSLMEKDTGEDLRNLLKQGVKLYRKAVEDDAKNKFVLQAIGILRATEHLSMAGLYAARMKYKQKETSPTPEWLTKVVAETDHRLEQLERKERGKGPDLFPVTMELVRRAEGSDHDAHLAFELAMAADALCFALESGL